MNSNVTYVPREKFESALTEAGLTWQTQSGFLKVEYTKGNRIYVAATKRVGRVDISGFEVDPSIGKVPHTGPFGNVKQQLRMEGTEDEILARFGRLLTELKAQPAKEPKPRVVKPKSEKPSSEAPETSNNVADRLALIKRVAAEKGVGVSKQTLAQASDEG